jgi:uncharacterized membrane protein
MRGDLGTRTVISAIITKMILCVAVVKRNLICRFVAIDLVTEFSRHFSFPFSTYSSTYSAVTFIAILFCNSWTRFH